MIGETDIFEQAKLFLPKYLTPDQTKELYSELARFPNISSFYFHRDDLRNHLLQGDGWRGFVAINFETGERKTVSGIILSNSCDVSSDNVRHTPVKILFAPLVNLGKYVALLRESGKSDTQIQDILQSIKAQKVSHIFYLPSYTGVIEESIILLDDIHNHPLADFLQRERSCLLRLNQIFFYIFLIKLSIHFSRFQEGVQRFTGIS